MGRAPCCDKTSVKRGPWSPEEDEKLRSYVQLHGIGGNWIALPQKAGLNRCGKSCRLRWLNYLRPNIKHGGYTEQEDRIICSLYNSIGSRWSIIASKLPGRTDNDVKNYWNTKLKKKTMAAFAVAPGTPLSPASSSVTSTSSGGGSGDGFFAAFTQPQGLIRFDAPPCRSPTELASVPPATTAMDGAGGVWASAPAGDAMAMDDVFLSELVGGGDTLFSYGDFFGGLQPQDRAFELSACYFPNMAEMWGAAAAGDHAHAKPQGLCNTLM
ncbi:hypothetical protein QOZ80_5BG0412080 [Eleusine coracana subsp. coracana]|nr:hypothetical protein QOZ80_5BG0412080 [Eleusine coracana subsp. coracana]